MGEDNLIGKKFNMLTVICSSGINKYGKLWKCLCDCGNKVIVPEYFLKINNTKSCGCLQKSFFNRPFIDLTNQRFGKLIALSCINKKSPVKWECLCDCGNKHIASSYLLRSGHTKSWGCINSPSLIGQKFGKLTVTNKSDNKKSGNVRWECLCDCGNTTEVNTGSLKSGGTKSCGCLKRYSDKTLSPKHALFYKYKNSAKIRNYSFDINFEDFCNLIGKNCYYCGKPPSQCHRHPDAQIDVYYNGIDRLNNLIGYKIDNVVTCCKECNYLKWDRDETEFIDWIKKCYNNLNLEKI